LHYPNEAARHKLLDVVGDLALIGTRIQVIANKARTFCKYTVCKKKLKSSK
jgi:UDP-3-O-[3-hydroxymyristoyl] N-acetylglucosamine deacetylase/3-hydroxyacyl-[acyl-carrier-protein] dehydratase